MESDRTRARIINVAEYTVQFFNFIKTVYHFRLPTAISITGISLAYIL